jgi:hypothetical protein
MFTRVACSVLAVFALSACDTQIALPKPVRGIWGNDCTSPVVEFTETGIHLYADNATYALTGVTFNGNNLSIKYVSQRGPVAETYLKSGETLRLERGNYAGADRAWNNRAMERCR